MICFSRRNIVVQAAHDLVGVASYQFKEEDCNPPDIVNCLIMTAWAFSKAGIKVPKYMPQLLGVGKVVASEDTIKSADIVFTVGTSARYTHHDHDRAKGGIGHVGIIDEANEMVIHACHRSGTVVEESIRNFIDPKTFRGIYRIIDND